MIKPKRLKKGDKIAVVSLSWGGLGDADLIHKYDIAKKRLVEDFVLTVVAMPHALKGSAFVAAHPELRAKDLMDAFEDSTIDAVFCAIGGDDTIRILPYVDIDTLRKHPKIFMGYSDTTTNHFMMFKAGLVSFYGPSIMCEFGEYGRMSEYTEEAVREVLFGEWSRYELKPSPEWSDDYVPWDVENINKPNVMKSDTKGYEVISGGGTVRGHLLGGCIDVFPMVVGTSIWPTIDEWRGAILFIETSEDKPSPDIIKWTFRNLAAQGILKVIKGIMVGKPQAEVYYDEYKTAIKQVVCEEEHLYDLPIFYNVNFGHAIPIGILPYGILTELNSEEKTITFLESVTTSG